MWWSACFVLFRGCWWPSCTVLSTKRWANITAFFSHVSKEEKMFICSLQVFNTTFLLCLCVMVHLNVVCHEWYIQPIHLLSTGYKKQCFFSFQPNSTKALFSMPHLTSITCQDPHLPPAPQMNNTTNMHANVQGAHTHKCRHANPRTGTDTHTRMQASSVKQ